MYRILVVALLQSSYSLECPPPPTSGLYACRNRSLHEVPLPIGAPIKNRLAITALDISDNTIQILHQDALRPYPALTCLRVERNRLWKITDLAFQAVPNMQRLLLRGNNLVIQPGCLSPKALLQMKHLKELDLSENPLGQLPIGFFPPTLIELRIEQTLPGLVFQPGALSKIFKLESLSLENNSFETLPAHINQELRSLKRLQRLNLNGNKWNCDCHLIWLSRLGREFNSSATCYKPEELKRRRIATLPVAEFQCAPMALNKETIGSGITDVEVGSTVTMMCHFYTEPRGRIRWFRGEVEGLLNVIEKGVGEYVVGDFLITTNLTLKEVRAGVDDGVYRCEAENKRGRDGIVFRLRVGYVKKSQEFGFRGYQLALTAAIIVGGGVLAVGLTLLSVTIYCCKKDCVKREVPRIVVNQQRFGTDRNDSIDTWNFSPVTAGVEEITQMSEEMQHQPIFTNIEWYSTRGVIEMPQF